MKNNTRPAGENKKHDNKFMKIALKLSLRGSGFAEPNPMVGAVVVWRRNGLS